MFKFIKRLNPFVTRYTVEESYGTFYVHVNRYFTSEVIGARSDLERAKQLISEYKGRGIKMIVHEEFQ